MRNFKFRVWDIKYNCYLPYDSYAITNDQFKYFGIMVRDWMDYKCGDFLYEEFQILEQYAGIPDKAGQEVFEGDIVSSPYKEEVFVVEFSEGEFVGDNSNFQNGVLSSFELLRSTVIGNIHENKDLFKYMPTKKI